MNIQGAYNALLGDLYTNIQKWYEICWDAFFLIAEKKMNLITTDLHVK
jgi:hypothetical protein